MSIIIKSVEDLRQLEKWMIDKISVQPPGLKLLLTHIAAESPVEITLIPVATPAMVGNVLTVNVGLNIETKDVPV